MTAAPPLLYTETTGSTPFYLNLHVGDVGHTTVYGPTGAGKSVFVATLAASFLKYPSAYVCVFDKGESMWALVNACEGAHYDPGQDEGLSFCPLRDIDDPNDRTWAEEWLGQLYTIRAEKSPSPHQVMEIHRALTLMAQNNPTTQRSITDFLLYLQSPQGDDLKITLEFYTRANGFSSLDGREDSLKQNAFEVFEMDELLSLGEKRALPVLLYLFRRFERRLNGQPALLILDEAWVLLGHPVFREKIRQWLKELRKKNCAVVLATQSLSDSIRSGIFDVLIESCPTKILLPNEEAEKRGTADFPGPRDFYTMMGLNDVEIQTLRNAVCKRDYYYVSPEGRRLFRLGLGPMALSFVAVSDKKTVAYLKDLKKTHGKQWPFVWMKERGIAV